MASHSDQHAYVASNQSKTSKCRSCLTRDGVLDISEARIDNLLLLNVIEFCTNEQISCKNELSTKICNLCFKKLHETYYFIKEFRGTQKKIIESGDTSVEMPSFDNDYLNDHQTSTKGDLDKFLEEFENLTPIEIFKKKFRRIGPIFKELCIALAENKKQLLRPDPTVAPLNHNKKEVEIMKFNVNPEINNVVEIDLKDIQDVKPNQGEDMEEILKKYIESHTTEEVDGIDYERFILSPHITEESMKKFISEFILANPIKKSDSSLQCFECLLMFDSVADLKNHSRITGHDILPLFKCNICMEFFKFRFQYKKHLKQHEGKIQNSICEFCGVCIRTYNLQRHLQKHQGGHSCIECGKKFTQKWCLQSHVKVKHELLGNVYKELCHLCGYQASTLSVLNQHMRKRHGGESNWTHSCKICNSLFMTNFSLRLHMHKKHTQNSELLKTELNKSVRSSLKPQTRKKSIAYCPYCSKKVAAATLRHHIRLHKRIKPYRCNICSRTFGQKINLTSHMNIHLHISRLEYQYGRKRFRPY